MDTPAPDHAALDRQVGTLHALAAETRLLAASLAGAASADWAGPAATRFRDRLEHESALAERCARLVDDAARALAVHGRAVRGGLS